MTRTYPGCVVGAAGRVGHLLSARLPGRLEEVAYNVPLLLLAGAQDNVAATRGAARVEGLPLLVNNVMYSI